MKALRDIWPHKLLVKGLLHPDDASKSLEYGADGIVVSNHGGRNCDTAPAPCDVLPEIVKAVVNRINATITPRSDKACPDCDHGAEPIDA